MFKNESYQGSRAYSSIFAVVKTAALRHHCARSVLFWEVGLFTVLDD